MTLLAIKKFSDYDYACLIMTIMYYVIKRAPVNYQQLLSNYQQTYVVVTLPTRLQITNNSKSIVDNTSQRDFSSEITTIYYRILLPADLESGF